ncbi:MAG: hypothetical protein KGH55_03455 [Nanoarchaeota archaeon]|nr:hypothetical protein [Nanoarchaeota archaeon]
MGRFEGGFWHTVERIGIFVAIPVLLGDLANHYLKWNGLYVMGACSLVLWIFYREAIISDLKKRGGKKNGEE